MQIANWVLNREKIKDTVTYYLYWNGKLKTSGTLKEIDNYIEGLYIGYGVEKETVKLGIVKHDTHITENSKPKPIKPGIVDFTFIKNCANKELAEQVGFNYIQEYHCVIQYLSKPEESYYMKVVIDRYNTVDKSKKSTVLRIPLFKFNPAMLSSCDRLRDRIDLMIGDIDKQLAENAMQELKNGDKGKAFDYLSTISSLHDHFSDKDLNELLKIYGKKLEGLYINWKDITNIKATNFYPITYFLN